MSRLNRDVAIVAISIVALLLVSYQAGYLDFGTEEDTVEQTLEEDDSGDTLPSSLDEIHPLASTCLEHGDLTRHDHMYLTIRVNGDFITIPENTGINTGTCNQTGATMHVVHTHSSDGKLHLEMQTEEDVELGVFFDIWGQHFDETGIFEHRVNETHGMTMSVRNGENNVTVVDTYDHFILLEGQEIFIDFGPGL